MKIGNLEIYGVIYKIENLVNGHKIYIGQTIREGGFNKRYPHEGIGIERVYKYHISRKNVNDRYNNHLVSSIEKYGFEAFNVNEIFDIAFSKEELDIKEKIWITYFDSINPKKGYNNREGGTDGILSEGSKKKMSKSAKARFKDKTNHPWYGKKRSKETISKMSAYMKTRTGKYSFSGRKIVCLTTKEIFNTEKEAEYIYNVNRNAIGNCCKGKTNYSGKLSDGTPLLWMFYEEYIKLSNEEIKNKLNNIKTYFKIVICVNTKEIFNTIADAGKKINTTPTHISRCCKGINHFAGKTADGTRLTWMYLEDYKNATKEEIEFKLYNAKNAYSINTGHNSKNIICITTEKIFNKVQAGANFYGCSKDGIGQCCRNKQNYCGKYPITGQPLQWKYIKDLNESEYIKYDIENKLREFLNADYSGNN